MMVILSILAVFPVRAQEAVRVNTVPETEILALSSEGDFIYAASTGNVYSSDDGGNTWEPAGPFPDGTSELSALFVHDNNVYVGTAGSGVFVSQNQGDSWMPFSTGLSGNALNITAIVVLGDSLYAGTNGAGVYVLSLQNPTGWSNYNTGLPVQGVVALSVSGEHLVVSGGTTGSMFIRSDKTPGWMAVPLDLDNPQNQIIEFLPLEPYLLAGTYQGIYRSTRDVVMWFPIETSLPASSDVVALTQVGARVYAGVQHQGYSIYSSDDFGVTWSLRSEVPSLIFDLLGSHNRLWVGRADGLWYYDLSSSPQFYQVLLMSDMEGSPEQKGSVLGKLEGNDFKLVGFFSGLTVPWLQIDLYHRKPDGTGELIKNLAITIPEGGGFSGTVDSEVTLTEGELASLLAGELYIHVGTLGNESDHLSGRVQMLPLEEPGVFESWFSYLRQGTFTRRGTMLAALEANNLRLIGAGWLDTKPVQIDLYRGAPGEPGEFVANLWLNFSVGDETSFGFDHTLPLSEALKQDLHDGLLYVEVSGAEAGRANGRLHVSSNGAPPASQIVTPSEGATIVIGGTGGADPEDPELLLADIGFTPSPDPDENPVTYIWQASRSPEFSAPFTVALDLGPDSTTIPLTVARAADIFDVISGKQPGDILLESPLTIYHRVITTDGARHTYGEPATFTFIRGTVTSQEPQDELPDTFTLYGNYPNPFNPRTVISFDLPTTAVVRVEVFNLLGRRVLELPARTMEAGAMRKVEIDGLTLPSGSYLYRVIIQSENQTQVATGKMTLLK